MDSIEQYKKHKEERKQEKERKKKEKVISKQGEKRKVSLKSKNKLATQKKRSSINTKAKKNKGKLIIWWKEYADNYKNRIKYGLIPTKSQEKKERSALVKKCDTLVSKIVRDRDSNNFGMIKCITSWCSSCSKKISYWQANACHCITRWYYSHRWYLSNVRWWCVSCNKYNAQEHWVEFVEVLKSKFWDDWRSEQRNSRHKRKPSIEWMQELHTQLKDILEKWWDDKYLDVWLFM